MCSCSDFQALLLDYQRHLMLRSLSQTTISLRSTNLRSFFAWLVPKRGVSDIALVDRQVIEDYARYLREYRKKRDGAPLAPHTVVRRIRDVAGFLHYLVKNGVLLLDPTARMDLPQGRARRRLPENVPTHRQVMQLLDGPNRKLPLGIRDRAILELLYSTALRRAECAGLDLFDVDLQQGTLRVRQGKGHKDRVVPLGSSAARWIARYLEHVRPEWAEDPAERALFISSRGGQRLSKGMIGLIVRTYARQQDLPAGTTTHALRHACATEMLRGGASIRHVQEMLGHSSLSATMLYTHVLPLDLQEVHRETHPRENDPDEEVKYQGPGAHS